MKKILTIAAFAGLATITSCDYISAPYEPIVGPTGKDCPEPVFPKEKSHRVVLLEDYTGHQCTACPKAAVEAAKLQNTYKEDLVVVAVHAGYFAAVSKPDYPEDFITPAGSEYAKKFKPANFPTGMINRIDFPINKHNKENPQTWGNDIAKQLALPVEMDLQLTCDYNADSNAVCVGVRSKFLSASIPDGTYMLCLMLTQDSIVAPQLDNGVYKPTYVHNHMLRDNLNGPWGTALSTGTVTLDEKITKFKYKISESYKGIPCKPKNCHIIAFVYDNATSRILQAAEEDVIP
jgi:hypothetical protein